MLIRQTTYRCCDFIIVIIVTINVNMKAIYAEMKTA